MRSLQHSVYCQLFLRVFTGVELFRHPTVDTDSPLPLLQLPECDTRDADREGAAGVETAAVLEPVRQYERTSASHAEHDK